MRTRVYCTDSDFIFFWLYTLKNPTPHDIAGTADDDDDRLRLYRIKYGASAVGRRRKVQTIVPHEHAKRKKKEIPICPTTLDS